MTTTMPEQTIKVQRTEVVKTGTRGNKPWTLYRVVANDEHDRPINEELRSFDALSGTVRVTYEPYLEQGVHKHWTLKKVKAPQSNGSGDVADLCERVDRLERQMKALIGNADIELPTGVSS